MTVASARGMSVMISRDPMEQRELFDRFVDTTLPADQFHHQQHVQVAWLFVQRYGMPAALGEFSAAIKRFADAKGATGLYHETITWAFLLLIAEREARHPAATWEEFEAVNADLLVWKPSILERYYSRELLSSDIAKRAFMMPDRV
ncbi:MAG TPA: hypothetical protein VM096_05535 [Vicinamibacterales bacterium]|nr:hypothetical protein [Vicinamibacterales bacterium]